MAGAGAGAAGWQRGGGRTRRSKNILVLGNWIQARPPAPEAQRLKAPPAAAGLGVSDL